MARWRADQKVGEREELEAGFRGIVSHPWFIGGRQLDPKRIELFHTACYDLDAFRRFVFESSFLQRFDVEEPVVREMRGQRRGAPPLSPSAGSASRSSPSPRCR